MGRLPFLFARRYLSSRKSLSVINIIARVSVFAIGVPVAAMIVLLSVFNGFDGLVRSMYGNFDPDIMITPVKGKVFDASDVRYVELRRMNDVEAVSYLLEGHVLFEYRGNQTAGILRGVDSMYSEVVPVNDIIVHGKYELRFGDMEQAVVGQGLAYELGVRTSIPNQLGVYAVRRGEFSSLLPIDGYVSGRLFPGGIFALDAATDGAYIFSSLSFAQRLLDYPGKASGIAVKLREGADVEDVKAGIAGLLGENFKVATRYEQKASAYRIMEYEKWAIFFISLMVLIIASFSIVGSLMMLIIDKRPDMRTFITMGADVRLVRKIFVNEGMLISTLGIAGGVAFGVLLCVLQLQFGIIKLGGQSFIIDAYPVDLRLYDVLVVISATLAVTWIITKFTVSRMIPRSLIRL